MTCRLPYLSADSTSNFQDDFIPTNVWYLRVYMLKDAQVTVFHNFNPLYHTSIKRHKGNRRVQTERVGFTIGPSTDFDTSVASMVGK